MSYTTDPDRILALAPAAGEGIDRPSVRAARAGAGRDRVVVELAREIDACRRRDARRVDAYVAASERYLEAFRRMRIDELPLDRAHDEACALAERWLPTIPPEPERIDADVE